MGQIIKNILLNFIKLIKNDWPILILVLVSLVVSYKNYELGTWLTGWDNLHPEFNPKINIKRSFFSMWQEYQGLGLSGGMAHAADLPRQLISWVFINFFEPKHFRYFWNFFMLLIGPLGMYFLATRGLFNNIKNKFITSLSGFVSGWVYLFNLATLQYFYTTYDSFVSFYGFLPWMIWGINSWYKKATFKKSILIFLLFLIASPAFYVQTSFVVLMICMGFFSVEAIFRQGITGISKTFKLLLIIIFASAYWLIPVIYFTFTSIDVVANSKINSFATLETQLQNAGAGSISNVIRLRGFWFESTDQINSQEGFIYLMGEWRDYIDSKNIKILSFVLFTLISTGFILSIFCSIKNWSISGFLLFIFTLLMLTSGNGKTGFIFQWLDQNIPLFGQIFRSAFTKWSPIAGLMFAWGAGALISIHFPKIKVFDKAKSIIIAIFVIGIATIISYPMLQGKLFNQQMRITIPEDYFELFDYFNTQPKHSRIAHFPVESFWGWHVYDWGYRGSGFLWYGIEQPFLDRAFDVWSPYNEKFYQEFSTAFYQNDRFLMKNVLTKYAIDFVFLDKNLSVLEKDRVKQNFNQMENLLVQVGFQKEWTSGNLEVYKAVEEERNHIRSENNYSKVKIDHSISRIDSIYNNIGNFISYEENENYLYFPFANWTDERVKNVSFGLDEISDSQIVQFQKSLSSEFKQLEIPTIPLGTIIKTSAKVSYSKGILYVEFPSILKVSSEGKIFYEKNLPNLEIPVDVDTEEVQFSIQNSIGKVKTGESVVIKNININIGNEITVNIFSNESQKLPELNLTESFKSSLFHRCWTRPGTEGFEESLLISDSIIEVTVKDASACRSLKLGSVGQTESLLSISLPFKSNLGSRPHFCLIEEGKEKCLTEEVFNKTQPSTEVSLVERKIIAKPNVNYWMDLALRPSSIEGKSWSIQYNSPLIRNFPLIYKVVFDKSMWNSFFTNDTVDLDGKTNLVFEVASDYQEINLFQNISEESRNCDVFNRGEVYWQIDHNGIAYTASEYAAFCDFYFMDNILSNHTYILRSNGEFYSGRPQKLYLYNHATKRNDLEILLDRNNKFDSFSLISWPLINSSQYTLNVETRSLGGEIAKSRIFEIGVYPIPFPWLEKIVAKNSNKENSFIKKATFSNDLEKNLYKKVVSTPTSNGVIELTQAFDKGWNAYTIKSDSEVWYRYPFIGKYFGKTQSLKQIKVNGWANGFILDENEQEANDFGEILDKNVVILYMPQYLQWIGFGLLVLFIPVSIFIHKIKSRKAKN